MTLLDQRGSRVVYGDIQLVPIGDGLLYVRPLYVRPDDANARQVFVRKFLAFYDNRVVIADSLGEAVRRMFPGYTGDIGDRIDDGASDATEDDSSAGTDATVPDDGSSTTTTVPSSAVDPGSLDAVQLLELADQLFAEADAALASTPPNFAVYQQKQAEARDLIRRALGLIAR